MEQRLCFHPKQRMEKDTLISSTTVHIISHTHWDREWYLPYEKHHVRLIALIDRLLETLERDSDFKSFHLDGQTIILEDYLQIRPEKRALLEQYVREGRIHIGPWYILQDEFLTSGEANVRNLVYGHRDAIQFGKVAKVGYFPDSFGNIGQAPQLMLQAGIENSVFGRGVKPTGFNNEVSQTKAYESPFSEMIWEAPDGSRVIGILFANWYSNGNEIPTDPEAAGAYWQGKLKDVAEYASTPHWLMMNGCDHQPVQTDVAQAIATAQQLFPEYQFVHSNFEDYIGAVTASLPEKLSVVKGELRSQHTDGWSTLVNTASSRIYLKQMNQTGQALLEKVAEPIAAFAYLTGHAYPHHLFTYAWKTLMQNHPHDSICGCSVDEVHAEMVTRFAKSKHVAESIIEDSLSEVASKVDTSGFASFGEVASSLVVVNTTGWLRSGIVTTDVEIERIYFNSGIDFYTMKQRLKEIDLAGLYLVESEGSKVSSSIEDLGVQFGYDLPEDQFRQPYFARKVRIQFEAHGVPALGYKTYALIRNDYSKQLQAEEGSLIRNEREMGNDYLTVTIADDGSLTIVDHRSNEVLRNQCIYEDTGDIGNEYMYRQPNGDVPLTTRGLRAEIRITEDTPFQASFEITHQMLIPKSAEELLQQEREELIWFTGRKSGRSDILIPFTIKTKVSLNKNGQALQIETTFNNEALDHRLRMLFPVDFHSQTHLADSIFEVVERDNTPSEEWRNPSNCQHQQAFVTLIGEKQGVTIANLGLNEYEVLRDEDENNTIAVTLLRAVGELGDWGYFPTPEAQCLGEHTVKLEIIPFPVENQHAKSEFIGHGAMASMKEAYQYQVPWIVKQTGTHEGGLPSRFSFMQWEGDKLCLSALKVSENTGDLIARWYNLSRDEQTLSVYPTLGVNAAHRSSVMEQRLEESELGRMVVRPAEIITLSLDVSL